MKCIITIFIITNAIIQITSKIGVYRKFNKIIYLSSY
ncbi:Uncharacterised protein [Bacteroides uniformis]|uniref:Uncharacterized protein n=1 Tax=Bacteroides uniformis TaxID=820 RepID=A0A174LL21_BACUN|nr:Uncharacterised protein [Bacteroides uniformis]